MTTETSERYAFTAKIRRGVDQDWGFVFLAGVPIWQKTYHPQFAIVEDEVMNDFAMALSSALGSAVSP